MEQIWLKKTEYTIRVKQDEVLKAIDCYEDSPVYDEVKEEFKELEACFYKAITPKAAVFYRELPDALCREDSKEGLFTVLTLGEEISKKSTGFFLEGDYLKGMLFDAMADNYLFQMDRELLLDVKQICAQKHLGIAGRMEAPNDYPLEVQAECLDKTWLDSLEMAVTDCFMLDPVKSNCYLLLLSTNDTIFRASHNCRSCKAYTCKFREVKPVNITIKETGQVVSCKGEQTILQAFLEHGIYCNSPCGGNGTCGKCKIILCEGDIPVTTEDKKFYTKEQIEKGFRLACKSIPTTDCVISFQDTEKEFEVVTEGQHIQKDQGKICKEAAKMGIGIDIGTTTVAVCLYDMESGQMLASYTDLNRQRQYGADVISRMQASNTGKKAELQACIKQELAEGILEVTKDVDKNKVEKIVIAGNTTMIHLLMGYSCKTLGVAPFTPVNIDTIYTDTIELLDIEEVSCRIMIMPGITTFVGGDIVSGLYAVDADWEKEPVLFIDLGTNGEMAVGKQDRFLVTSTAAGPAFEGGNITWGTGSIRGAVCKAVLNNDSMQIETIGHAKPVGICGTGVIELTAELLNHDLIEESGLLDEEYFEDGYPVAHTEDGEAIVFTQKDIREIQLAKAAVRAGMETLLDAYGITYEQVAKVYVAGGFGYKMNIAKSVVIGLFPEELQDKIMAVGNSSLSGAAKALTETSQSRIKEIVDASEEISLSNDKRFQEYYMEYMMFGEE